MKILIFSDSHGRMLHVYDAMERERPDAVIHLGDCTEDARELEHSYPHIPFWYVCGNNDFAPDIPLQKVIAPEGVPMYLTHGHRERVSGSSLGNLVRESQRADCKIALYGHTHRMRLEERENILVLNPGSISLPRGGGPSYAVIQVSAGEICSAKVLDVEGSVLFQRVMHAQD